MTQVDAQAPDEVAEGIISISDVFARCLFDSKSTHSFIALYFAPTLHVAPAFLEIELSVATLAGASIDIDVVVYQGYAIKIREGIASRFGPI